MAAKALDAEIKNDNRKVAVKDGHTVWIEVKTPKGRLSKHQEQFRDDIWAHGGIYLVARSVEDIERELKERRLA